jgi:hypothetical protein
MPVRFLRTDATPVHAVAITLVALLATAFSSACTTPAVGAPCLPEQVPSGGFDESEAYIESSSVQCETRVCMVYHLSGAPSETTKCVPKAQITACPVNDKNCIPAIQCADPDDIVRRVYCTCRCESGDPKFASCSCPSGYSCRSVLEQGSVGVKGSYCVRSDSVNVE